MKPGRKPIAVVEVDGLLSKACSLCRLVKPLPEYHKNKNSHSGYDSYCKLCRRIAQSDSRKLNPERTQSRDRTNHLWYLFGLTTEAYNKLLADQNGLCAICKCESDKMVVDHDHTTNNVRGLLCQNCNTAIGMLSDSIPNLESAISYLKHSFINPV